MIRIVVGQSGHHFVVYRDDCHLGDIERFFDGAGGSVWRWHADGLRGEEPTLGDGLDAIARARRSGTGQTEGMTGNSFRHKTRRPAGA